MTAHDRIVYVIAVVSATAVGLAYVASVRSISWVWPAFVAISTIIVGVILVVRRGKS